MLTNLDIIQRYFKKAFFEANANSYTLANGYRIDWIDGENFTVEYDYFDFEVGYVTDDNLYNGNLIQCLNYILKNTGQETSLNENDYQDYLKVVQNENC